MDMPTSPRRPPGLLVCSGSMNQFTAIYNGSGELINHIKYYDGFMGQRVGAISCLAFHPHWVCVSAPVQGLGVGEVRGGASSRQRPPPRTTVSRPRISRGRSPQSALPLEAASNSGTQGRHEVAPLFVTPLGPAQTPAPERTPLEKSPGVGAAQTPSPG